jgi:hypothetical protein
MERRLFTVHEANELIPFLSGRLKSLRGIYAKLKVWGSVNPTSEEIMIRGGMPVAPEHVEAICEFRETLDEICREGCVVKDLDSGLVDFPTIWEGREVLLCWKLGEPEVGHWHEIEAGFAGRQSLTTEPPP